QVDPCRMTPRLELALETPCEVVVAPGRRALPVRCSHEDRIAIRLDPPQEMVADLFAAVAVRVPLEHLLPERRLELAGRGRLAFDPVEDGANLVRVGRDRESLPEQRADADLVVGHDEGATGERVEDPR